MSETREKYEFKPRPTAIISMTEEDRDKLVAEARREEQEKWLPLWKVNKKLVKAIENIGAPVEEVEQILAEIYSVMQGLGKQKPQETETIQLRKWLFYLVERVPIDADPTLVQITQYIQPFAKRGDFKNESK